METKFFSLSKNHTWALVSGMKGKNIMNWRWVYMTKFTSEGVVE
jgi:hypothetical protein